MPIPKDHMTYCSISHDLLKYIMWPVIGSDTYSSKVKNWTDLRTESQHRVLLCHIITINHTYQPHPLPPTHHIFIIIAHVIVWLSSRWITIFNTELKSIQESSTDCTRTNIHIRVSRQLVYGTKLSHTQEKKYDKFYPPMIRYRVFIGYPPVLESSICTRV